MPPPPPSKDPPADTPEGARRRALRALVRREHSATELARKLESKGVPEELAREVISDFNDRGWQSDERYAEVLARSRAMSGYGPLRIRAELLAGGVGESLVNAALNDLGYDWKESAAAQRQRRFGEQAPTSPKEWQKQYRYLAQRGFSAEQVSGALKSSEFIDEE